MTTTKAIDALLEAQKKFGKAAKNRENPFHKSKYADYDSVLDAVQAPLNENGFVIQHMGISHDGKDYLRTELRHISGEVFISEFPLMLDSNPQKSGSLITYLKRYNLSALTGISTEDDDDGNAAAHGAPGRSAARTAKPAPKSATKANYGRDGYISEAQGKRLWAISREHGVSDVALKTYLQKTFNVQHSYDIRRDDYDAICKAVESGMLVNHGDDVQEPEPVMSEKEHKW